MNQTPSHKPLKRVTPAPQSNTPTRRPARDAVAADLPRRRGRPPQQSEIDLEKRWANLKCQLENEREFWPADQRRELRLRILSVLNGWPEALDRIQIVLETRPKKVRTYRYIVTKSDAPLR